MKILVTGNMGYLGPAVVRMLRAAYPEARLIGLDIGFYKDCLSRPGLMPESVLDSQIILDVRKVTPEVLAGVDTLIHLAALSNDAMGELSESFTYEINHRASVHLARMAKAAGVKRFLFASSCSVYGFSENGWCTETSPANPLTAYARSKYQTEQGLQPLASADFQVTCFRFATACGMSERLRLDLVLNDFVAAAVTAGEIKILSDGTPWRPLIHIQDMARAFLWAVQREAGGHFVLVNAGANEWNLQVHALAQAVAASIPGTRVSMNPQAVPDKRSYRVDFGLFRRLAPDHQPLITLEKAIAGLREGIQRMEYQGVDFRKSQFIRMNILKQLVIDGRLSLSAVGMPVFSDGLLAESGNVF